MMLVTVVKMIGNGCEESLYRLHKAGQVVIVTKIVIGIKEDRATIIRWLALCNVSVETVGKPCAYFAVREAQGEYPTVGLVILDGHIPTLVEHRQGVVKTFQRQVKSRGRQTNTLHTSHINSWHLCQQIYKRP